MHAGGTLFKVPGKLQLGIPFKHVGGLNLSGHFAVEPDGQTIIPLVQLGVPIAQTPGPQILFWHMSPLVQSLLVLQHDLPGGGVALH